jgi:hypothetical protein
MIIPYEYEPLPDSLLEFIEAYDSRDLHFLSTDLLQHFGFEDEHAVDNAIRRAIHACVSLKISHARHFRHVFIAREQGISHAWKLSVLGCYLTILNEDPSHPLVAQMQASLFFMH